MRLTSGAGRLQVEHVSANIKRGLKYPLLRQIVHSRQKKAIPEYCVQQAVEISY